MSAYSSNKKIFNYIYYYISCSSRFGEKIKEKQQVKQDKYELYDVDLIITNILGLRLCSFQMNTNLIGKYILL